MYKNAIITDRLIIVYTSESEPHIRSQSSMLIKKMAFDVLFPITATAVKFNRVHYETPRCYGDVYIVSIWRPPTLKHG